MKQVLENYRNGSLRLADVPAPSLRAGSVLVRTAASLVSIGTERAMIELAGKGLVGKAIARPDWVRQVIDKVQSDGLLETYRQVRARLDMPVPLGYSAAGIVLEVASGVRGIRAGDRVACAGHPYAGHAEVICVPRNLVVPVPEKVSLEDASFCMLGAIALNAVRLAEPALGERVAVIGTGLLGLLSLQMLRAAGCGVLAIDIEPAKLQLARELGADEIALAGPSALTVAQEFSGGQGVDAAMVFASANSAEPLDCAAAITRERGRIVVPGLVRLELPRQAFFEKELRLVVPKAGGPGGTDPDYEVRGRDLPLPYVRWTEGRNLQAFLELIATGRLTVKPLITHRFPIVRAMDAYAAIESPAKDRPPAIGIVLGYPEPGPREPRPAKTIHLANRPRPRAGDIGVGLIGAGLFVRGVLLPALRGATGLTLRGVATPSGVSALHAAETAGFAYCTSDYREILEDAAVHAVLIATRHDLHARIVADALAAGKHVFVEKPLTIGEPELQRVLDAFAHAPGSPLVMVGFNRRFAPSTQAVAKQLGQGPCLIHCRVNAGAIPGHSWVQDREGGGRIIGEVCHFVDLIHFLSGSLTREVSCMALTGTTGVALEDNLSITLSLDNGSVGHIFYVSNGDKSFPRERVEIFRAGSVGVIENFRSYTITRGGRTKEFRALSVDRGHQAELAAFFQGIRCGQPPVEMKDYAVTTQATFAIHESLRSKSVCSVSVEATAQDRPEEQLCTS